jgi:hypothetical protein
MMTNDALPTMHTHFLSKTHNTLKMSLHHSDFHAHTDEQSWSSIPMIQWWILSKLHFKVFAKESHLGKNVSLEIMFFSLLLPGLVADDGLLQKPSQRKVLSYC